MEKYTRLCHLSVRLGYVVYFKVGPAIVGAGLHSRLESLGLDTCFRSREWDRDYIEEQMSTLVGMDWPRLRLLDVGRLGPFLDALEKRPGTTAPFPALRTLGVKWLEQGDARRLLTLIDGGTLPALRALDWPHAAPGPMWKHEGGPAGADDDTRDQCALLERLSGTKAIAIQNGEGHCVGAGWRAHCPRRPRQTHVSRTDEVIGLLK